MPGRSRRIRGFSIGHDPDPPPRIEGMSARACSGEADEQMDPIVSLHYYAPVCAVINAFIIPFTEGLEPFYALHKVGLLVLFTNAGMAFALNVSYMVLAYFGADV
jgi:hypothetical protein